MKIAVLGGSPKGDTSVTMQYVAYIQAKHPEHELDVIQVSSRIARLEKNANAFDEIIDRIRTADGVLWAFPLYYMLVPSQYKRFIELISERGATDAFHGRYAAVLTTSIHFYDHVAHVSMREICDDLGMRYVGGLSAAMDDLTKEEGRARTEAFARHFFDAIERRAATFRSTPPLVRPTLEYAPSAPAAPVDAGSLRIVILHDATDADTNLGRMVSRLAASFSGNVSVHNLRDLDIRAGCQGCLQCAQANRCVFEGKDEYIDFFRDRLMPADILVLAGSVIDRNLSSVWRKFFDRSFFRNHCPSFNDTHMAYLVSGPLAQVPMLRQFLEAYVEIQEASLAGIVTDEVGDSDQLDALVSELAFALVRNAGEGYSSSVTCLGLSARTIFRDAVYGPLRGVFQADHRYYTKHGRYDFPNRQYRLRLLNFVLTQLFRIPRIRHEFDKRIKPGLITGLKKVVVRASA